MASHVALFTLESYTYTKGYSFIQFIKCSCTLIKVETLYIQLMIIVQLKILSYHIYHFEFPSCLLVLVISSCLLFCPCDMTSEFNLWEWVLNTSVIFVTSYRPPTLDEEVLRWGGVCCHADSRGSQWMEVNLQVLPSYHIILFPVGVFFLFF